MSYSFSGICRISILAILILAVIAVSGCRKNTCLNPVSGQLKNLTGLDGCGWVIQLNQKDPDGLDKLEPVNLDNFNVTLTDGQRVEFTYKEVYAGSICMVGRVVELKSIKDK